MVDLVAIEGELEGEIFELREGENLLGRSASADVVLPSEFISRAHARVLCRVGSLRIFPVSDKRVEVNGEATSGCELKDGDRVRLGRTTLLVRAPES